MNRIYAFMLTVAVSSIAFSSTASPAEDQQSRAEDSTDARKVQAQQALNRLSPVRPDRELLVLWPEDRATPVRVAGFRWVPPDGLEGVDVATAFLAAFPELVSVSAEALVLSRAESGRQRTSYRFEQRFEGLEVLGGEVVVLADADGRVISLVDHSVPVALAPGETISKAEAAERAWLAVTGRGPASTGPERALALSLTRKVVLARGGAPRLAYRVVVPTIPLLEKFVVLVDAHSGDVLSKNNEVIR